MSIAYLCEFLYLYVVVNISIRVKENEDLKPENTLPDARVRTFVFCFCHECTGLRTRIRFKVILIEIASAVHQAQF